MHRLARALTGGDTAEAEDLTGDAVRVALDSPPRPQGPVRPWLGGVLRNLARLRARTGVRRRRRDAAALAVDGSAPSPGELVERLEAQQLVASLVLGLPEPFRSTVLLRYYEDLSAAEVARRLNIPAGTVRWRLKHALDELRPALDRAHGGRRERWQALLLPVPVQVAAGTPRPAPSGPVPARTNRAWGIGLLAKMLAAAACALLLALGAAGVQRLAHRGSRWHSAPMAAAGRWPAGTVMQLDARGPAPVAVETSDPAGGLRIEGQVIDPLENPLGGALVAIDSNPPRTVVTRPDGGFVLEGLMPRLYRLEASAGDLYAGPAETRLPRGSEPIILRTWPGQKVRVEVRAGGDGHAIEAAEVTLRSVLSWRGQTDPGGAVVFTGVAPGWLQVSVEAPGFAPAHPRRATTGENDWEVRLESGAPVEGRVLDARGAAVAGATVWASLVSERFPDEDPRPGAVTTDAEGRWRLAAVAAGRYWFEASHPEHAQGITAPTIVDGTGSGLPVDVRLEDGGTVRGEVRSPDGRPLASVQVRAAVEAGEGQHFAQEAFTDGGGRFRLRGLPRKLLDIVAVSDQGSSPIVPVDLDTNSGERDISLVLSVDGAIAGMVVDQAGHPIAEAQVVANPDLDPDFEGWREWELRGRPRFISDSSGRFRFAGLPAAKYRLRAGTGPGDMLSPYEGVPARPGDHDVRIVVSGRGSLTGTVVYDDGTAPPRFSVTVGTIRRELSGGDGGAFSVEVPAGHADAIVAGSTFASTPLPGIDIAEGKSADLGLVKVKRGRVVSGRVLRAGGGAVVGAAVVAAPFLAGDGRKVSVRPGISGVHETRSGEDGRFSFEADDGALVVVAENPGLGRSRSIQLAQGAASADVDLVLEATGSAGGVISRAGRPSPEMTVGAYPLGVPNSRFFVTSGPDGCFQFDALAPGAYRVTVSEGNATKGRGIFSNSLSVEGGRSTQVDIDIPSGTETLTVDVRTEEGDDAPASSVLVLPGTVGEASCVSDLLDHVFAAPDGPASLYLGGWDRPVTGPIAIANLVPGTYTICSSPFSSVPASQRDPTPVKCIVQRLDSSTNVSLTVPAGWGKP